MWSLPRMPACVVASALVMLGWSAETSWATVRFGVSGGVGWTELAGTPVPDPMAPLPYSTAQHDTRVVGEIGVMTEISLRGPWVVSSGAAWSPIADRWTYVYVGSSGVLNFYEPHTVTTSLEMVALPLRVEWHRGILVLGAGPELRYLHRAVRDVVIDVSRNSGALETSRVVAVSQSGSDLEHKTDVSDLYERWSVAGSAMAGLNWPGAHCRVELRWTEGLTDISKVEGENSHIRAVQVGLSLLW